MARSPRKGAGMDGAEAPERALRPEDLDRMFLARGNAGDVEGLVALYEPDAVLAFPPGQLAIGTRARAAWSGPGQNGQAQAGGGGLECVDGRLGGLVRWAGHPELLLVPQVNPGLVADLDRGWQPGEHRVPSLDDRVLGVPGQVRAIEVGQVVVQDAGLR